MVTTVELSADRESILKWVEGICGRSFAVGDISVKPYCYDERNDWNTHIVVVAGVGVIGFTNGVV